MKIPFVHPMPVGRYQEEVLFQPGNVNDTRVTWSPILQRRTTDHITSPFMSINYLKIMSFTLKFPIQNLNS